MTGWPWLAILFVAGVPRIVINEVLYDPPGGDAGGEFVELVNASDGDVALDPSWTLERGNGANPGDWDVVWTGRGTVLPPGAFLVVGDHPAADDDVPLFLQNGPDACRLRHGGRDADLVGWGAHTFPEYVEGTPAEDPSFGLIARIVDGLDRDDNGLDFVATTRSTPGAPNFLDADLAIEPAFPPAVPALPEPFEAFALAFVLRNVGRESVADAGIEANARVVWLASPLPAGGVRDMMLPMPGRMAGRAEWIAHTTGRLDTTRALPVVLAIGAGPVRINEIMASPDGDEPEWIELLAREPQALTGWRVRDASGAEAPLGGFLGAGVPVVLTREPDRLLGAYPTLSPDRVRDTPSLPSLNDTDERLYVIGSDATLSDAVPYSDAPRGRSLERLHPDLSGRDPAAFAVAASGATPGARNSVFALPPETTELSVTPPVVGTSGTTIRYHLGSGEGEVRVSVVDMTGREQARLRDGDGSGRGVLHWDGTTGGRRLSPGLYVLVAMFTQAGTEIHEADPVCDRMAGVRGAWRILVLACASAAGAHATPFAWVPSLPIEWTSGTHLPAPPGMALLDGSARWGVAAARRDADVGASSMSGAVSLHVRAVRVAASAGQFGVSFYREQRASIALGGPGIALVAEARQVRMEGARTRRGLGWAARFGGRAAGFAVALDVLPRHVTGEALLFGSDWDAHVAVPAGAAALGASLHARAGSVRTTVRLVWISEPASLGFALDPGDGMVTVAFRLITRDVTALAGVTWHRLLGARRWVAVAGGSP